MNNFGQRKFQVREITGNSPNRQPLRRGSVQNQNLHQQSYHTQVYNEINRQQHQLKAKEIDRSDQNAHFNASMNFVRQGDDGYEALPISEEFQSAQSEPTQSSPETLPTLETLASSPLREPNYLTESSETSRSIVIFSLLSIIIIHIYIITVCIIVIIYWSMIIC